MSFDSQAEGFAFPTYRSHKRVKAAKITRIYSDMCVHTEPGASFTFDPSGKPKPQIGWYVVCYADGHVSFSPPEAFEGGYAKVDPAA
jgi:prepilin-type processing-associated H-X9-DG protein